MTALHERLLALHKVIGGLSTGLTGNTVLLSARQNAEIHATLSEAATALQSSGGEVRLRVDRDWSDYPIGTKAHAVMGGYWIRAQHGWKWFNGSTFPTPGGDACGACIELPKPAASPAQPSGFVLVPDDVIAFLNGTGELHGCTFGETPPGVRGKYWWRNYLTAAPAPIEQEGCDGLRNADEAKQVQRRD